MAFEAMIGKDGSHPGLKKPGGGLLLSCSDQFLGMRPGPVIKIAEDLFSPKGPTIEGNKVISSKPWTLTGCLIGDSKPVSTIPLAKVTVDFPLRHLFSVKKDSCLTTGVPGVDHMKQLGLETSARAVGGGKAVVAGPGGSQSRVEPVSILSEGQVAVGGVCRDCNDAGRAILTGICRLNPRLGTDCTGTLHRLDNTGCSTG